jgi:hypothetical protein
MKLQGGFPMTLNAILRATALATIITSGMTAAATAQTTAADPHHPDTTAAQAAPSTDPEPGMMQPGTMGQDMMQPGMMGAMPMMRMRGHMMKVMFAIADTDGDGALSFEEITAIHKRIFDKVDANKDGKVTPEEVQAFMRE